MKNIAACVMLITLLFACDEATKKKNDKKTNKENPVKEETNTTLSSGDYSTLLIKYECNMNTADVARIFNVPETDVSITKYQKPGRCAFSIKGFGENGLGKETTVEWFLEEVGKAQVNKEINTYLDDQANNESVLGMGILLSETGDSYITKQPMHGRVVIMNGNYDSWLFMGYSPKHMYKSRTQEQHDALGEKMIGLANYLLKKHKK